MDEQRWLESIADSQRVLHKKLDELSQRMSDYREKQERRLTMLEATVEANSEAICRLEKRRGIFANGNGGAIGLNLSRTMLFLAIAVLLALGGVGKDIVLRLLGG